MQQFTTPMMQQYKKIREQYKDCLLFYRMGDFYELFLEDAYIGAQVLNITLTSRPKGKDGRIPMAGVPYHAVDSYLAKLVKAGYKVAICEQVSLPNKNGIIQREVVRIVTPGTILDEKALDQKNNNYIIAIDKNDEELAISICDISTGFFATKQISFSDISSILVDELTKLHPVECILPESLYNTPEFLKIIKSERGISIYHFPEWETYSSDAEKYLQDHFGVHTLESFGISHKKLAIATSAALLGYLQNTQKSNLHHITTITTFQDTDYVILDKSTIINLELFSTIREHDVQGSLLSVIDQTLTAPGGRLLKLWLQKPLAKKEEIEERLAGVEELLADSILRKKIQEALRHIIDVERIIARLSVNIGNPRDVVNLKDSFKKIIEVKNILHTSQAKILQKYAQQIDEKIITITKLIESTFVDEPPVSTKEGGIIRDGINNKLDNLRKIVGGNKEWLTTLEKEEKKKTGIASLKVRFNQVFGFYIEVSKANSHLVPNYYIRKQTLVNGERFITPQLKEKEEIILAAEEEIYTLEYTLFTKILQKILSLVTILLQATESIAVIDCLCNFAFIAEKNRYNRPKLIYSGEIKLVEARHPVVEKLLEDQTFVPNDVELNNRGQQLFLITGPNMAGKSVFIRQTALIVLLAQIGSFVPAKHAYITPVDKIFVRSGASDIITSGLSTFMVEMVETAHILHFATKNSLIIMDEIGRGTSTYDGISIAWAVAEYLVTHPKNTPKTLFATHYHELQLLEQEYPRQIKNFHMEVENKDGQPIFMHTIMPGGASHSFGVAVAKLAGVPKEVIERALVMLEKLEKRQPLPLDKREHKQNYKHEQENISFKEHILSEKLLAIDIHTITPLDALNLLATLKEKAKASKIDKTFLQKKSQYLDSTNQS